MAREMSQWTKYLLMQDLTWGIREVEMGRAGGGGDSQALLTS